MAKADIPLSYSGPTFRPLPFRGAMAFRIFDWYDFLQISTTRCFGSFVRILWQTTPSQMELFGEAVNVRK